MTVGSVASAKATPATRTRPAIKVLVNFIFWRLPAVKTGVTIGATMRRGSDVVTVQGRLTELSSIRHRDSPAAVLCARCEHIVNISGLAHGSPSHPFALVPTLAVERVLRLRREPLPLPMAVVGERAQAQVLISLNPEAERAGLRQGQPFRDATAMCPGLVTVAETPAADQAFLHALRRWAGKFQPVGGGGTDRGAGD